MSQRKDKTKIKGWLKFIAVLGILLLSFLSLAIESFAQRQTPIGEINGKPIYAETF